MLPGAVSTVVCRPTRAHAKDAVPQRLALLSEPDTHQLPACDTGASKNREPSKARKATGQAEQVPKVRRCFELNTKLSAGTQQLVVNQLTNLGAGVPSHQFRGLVESREGEAETAKLDDCPRSRSLRIEQSTSQRIRSRVMGSKEHRSVPDLIRAEGGAQHPLQRQEHRCARVRAIEAEWHLEPSRVNLAAQGGKATLRLRGSTPHGRGPQTWGG